MRIEGRQSEMDHLKWMLHHLRLPDLRKLLVFAGKSKLGNKVELKARIIRALSKDLDKQFMDKVRQLYEARFLERGGMPCLPPPLSTEFRRETRSRARIAESFTSLASDRVGSGDLQLSVGQKSSREVDGKYYNDGVSSSTTSPRLMASATAGHDSAFDFDATGRLVSQAIGSSTSALYNDYSEAARSALLYPIHPDVKMRQLPFYDVQAVLIKPSSLQPNDSCQYQDQSFSFHLTPHQASAILSSGYRDADGRHDFKKQIQLRFSLLETSCEQNDNFPLSLIVKVNGRILSLPSPILTNKPNIAPKRPPKPLDITALCKLNSTSPNFVNVSWIMESAQGYTLSVYYVDKLTSVDLLNRLKSKGLRNSDYTRAVIKDKLNDKDSEIYTTSCKVSLACPLGKVRMWWPCRALTCDHLQCFDASLYLEMNEKKAKWLCPVCNQPALYENLMLDGFFSEVLQSPRLPMSQHEIVLYQDGSWDPLGTKAEHNQASSSSSQVETFSVDEDDGDVQVQEKPSTSSSAIVAPVIECITLDSDEENEDDDDSVIAPPLKRSRLLLDDDGDDDSGSSDSVAPINLMPEAMLQPLLYPSAISDSTTSQSSSDSPPLICID